MVSRILVTGAGGAAAVSLIRHLGARSDVVVYAADVDPDAAGLYLVPPHRRSLLLRGDAPGFTAHLLWRCVAIGVDAVIPTVDAELLPVARSARVFESSGVRVALAREEALSTCLDKAKLLSAVADDPVGTAFWVVDERLDVDRVRYPVVAKPRTGSGGRGVRIVEGPDDLVGTPRDGGVILQQLLPGAEYSVDVFVGADGRVGAAVPRLRAKVDSGVAVAGRTLHDPELEDAAARVAALVGLTGVANVQLRRDAGGAPRLLEINPRFPGTMPLTVAAGADIPGMVLDQLRGRGAPKERARFREVAMVRTWQETFLPPEEVDSLHVRFAVRRDAA